MRLRGGPAQHVTGFLPLAAPQIPEAADAIARARAQYAAGAENPPGELADLPPSGAPEAPEPRPNSPEDAGYMTREQRAAPAAAPGPTHVPKTCSSCSAPILWAQVLDENGHRVRRDDGRFKSMPVDFQPNPLKGNVVLFDRPGEGIVCRVLRRGEAAPPGARLRTSHFASCPNANQHRRNRR